ncbi:hypothetical protein PENTCL1PPCAC_1277, partial [Pristionchus entomophagus]
MPGLRYLTKAQLELLCWFLIYPSECRHLLSMCLPGSPLLYSHTRQFGLRSRMLKERLGHRMRSIQEEPNQPVSLHHCTHTPQFDTRSRNLMERIVHRMRSDQAHPHLLMFVLQLPLWPPTIGIVHA